MEQLIYQLFLMAMKLMTQITILIQKEFKCTIIHTDQVDLIQIFKQGIWQNHYLKSAMEICLIFFWDGVVPLSQMIFGQPNEEKLIVSEDSEVNFLTISPLKYILGFSNPIRTEKRRICRYCRTS
jgi:hypothetical protein